jgi:hypothetical protein
MQFISELHEHDRCSDFFHHFLDMIRDHMLVVEIDGQDGPQRARYSCKLVRDNLSRWQQEGEKNADYLMLPKPRPPEYLAPPKICRSNLPTMAPPPRRVQVQI